MNQCYCVKLIISRGLPLSMIAKWTFQSVSVHHFAIACEHNMRPLPLMFLCTGTKQTPLRKCTWTLVFWGIYLMLRSENYSTWDLIYLMEQFNLQLLSVLSLYVFAAQTQNMSLKEIILLSFLVELVSIIVVVQSWRGSLKVKRFGRFQFHYIW